MIVLVNIAGLILIGLIIWWFWVAKPKNLIATKEPITIIVENGVYTPSRIEVSVGQKICLRFLRKDAGPCAEIVVFPDFNLTKNLSLEQATELELMPTQAGEYDFTCQMKMYHGTLVVK